MSNPEGSMPYYVKENHFSEGTVIVVEDQVEQERYYKGLENATICPRCSSSNTRLPSGKDRKNGQVVVQTSSGTMKAELRVCDDCKYGYIIVHRAFVSIN